MTQSTVSIQTTVCTVCSAPNQIMRFCLECGARLRQPAEIRKPRQPQFATAVAAPALETGSAGSSTQRPVAEVIARQQLHALRRRLVLGEVHGDRVAEVTARRRPDDGIIAGIVIVTITVIVAFAIGFASIAIAQAQKKQAGAELKPLVVSAAQQ
jgi:hypothetical protein